MDHCNNSLLPIPPYCLLCLFIRHILHLIASIRQAGRVIIVMMPSISNLRLPYWWGTGAMGHVCNNTRASASACSSLLSSCKNRSSCLPWFLHYWNNIDWQSVRRDARMHTAQSALSHARTSRFHLARTTLQYSFFLLFSIVQLNCQGLRQSSSLGSSFTRHSSHVVVVLLLSASARTQPGSQQAARIRSS